MKKSKVISSANLSSKLPITFGIAVYLLLDKIQPTELVWGIAITLYTIIFILSFIDKFFLHEPTDIFATTEEKAVKAIGTLIKTIKEN